MKRSRVEAVDQAAVAALSDRMRRSWPSAANDSGVDLEKLAQEHAGPHSDAKIEWWYINGHVPSLEASFFASFFILAVSEGDVAKGKTVSSDQARRVHCLNWAWIDRKNQRYHPCGRLDYDAQAVFDLMDAGTFPSGDPFVEKALRELFGRGQLLEPDLAFQGDARAFTSPDGSVRIDYDGDQLIISPQGSCTLRLAASRDTHAHWNGPSLQIELKLEAVKPPMLHGRNGVVSAGDSDVLGDMFYYVIPRMSAVGTVRIDGVEHAVNDGTAWLDHEFGGAICETSDELALLQRLAKTRGGSQPSWEWAALQLSNDTEVSLTRLVLPDGDDLVVQTFAIVREGDTPAYRIDDIELSSIEEGLFVSTISGQRFPTRWKSRFTLRSGEAVALDLVASFPQQEFVTLAAKPSFWEGHATVAGQWGSSPVSGDAFLEVHARDSKGSEAVDTAYVLTNAVLVDPAMTILDAVKPEDFAAARSLVSTVMEKFVSLIKQQSPSAVPSLTAQEVMIRTIWALHRKSNDALALTELETFWLEKAVPQLRPDMQQLVLRAWMLRQIAETSQTATPTAEPAAPAAGNAECEFETVEWDRLTVPASDSAVAGLRGVFDGTIRMDREASEKLNPLLVAEGVNMVVRQLTDRLVPTLTVQVGDGVVKTHVKTTVSSQDIPTRIDGSDTEWFSSGRGNLVTRAQIQDGGRTLYTRTFIPPNQTVSVEHKWFRATEVNGAGAGTTFLEVYRYDPSGVEDERSVRVQRTFRRIE